MFSVPSKIIYVIFLVIYLSIRCESVPKGKYNINSNFTKILSYKLIFTPNFEKRTFKLNCVWVVKNTENVNDYQFYSKNLDVKFSDTQITRSSCSTKSKRHANVKYRDNETHPDSTDITTYSFKGVYPPGYYNLEFQEITGSLENDLQGFYYDEYLDENGVRMPYLVTQFGPIGARYAFPSWDEPKFRAIFKITINRPKLYSCVISNSPRKMTNPHVNFTLDIFENTEQISTSSLTFLVSNFRISGKTNGSIHQIIGRPEIIDSQRHVYVASLINRIYEEVENFLQVSCEQESLYHVALPSNKMKFESLGTYRGVNHYREEVLIFSNQTSFDKQESSTIAIAKLIAQQWFLSYLMVDRWTSVWISEGLTMYLAYKATEKLYPDWIIKERLICETRISMLDDSRCCYLPLNEEAQKPSEIEGKFNRVTLYKGTALITMMEKILPPNVLKKGITNLIKNKKWSTYSSEDLYEEIEAVLKVHNGSKSFRLPFQLSKTMSPWETLIGYPIVTVTRSYSTFVTDYIFISQKRFHLDAKERKVVWNIPINYATGSKPNFGNTRPALWLERPNQKIKITRLEKNDWLILNNQASYYYRVQYDDKNWNAIRMALMKNFTEIHYLNRMQIIDDAFSLAELGMLKYSIAFKISRYIEKEREYAPLKAMKEALQLIHKKLAGSMAYETFRKFIKSTVEHIYEAIKHNKKKNDMALPNPKLHRQHLIFQMLFTWLCDLKSKICDPTIVKLDDTLRAHLLGDFEKHTLCTTMRKANESHWNQFFDEYKNSFKSKSSPNNTIEVLGCSEDSALLEKFLIYIMKSQKEKLIVVIQLMIKQEFNGLNLVLKYITSLFDDLLNISTQEDIKEILNEIGSRVTTEEQLGSLIAFSKKHPKHNYLIESSLSIARKNIEWRAKHLRGFENQFQNPKSIGTKHYSNLLAFVLIISYYAN